MKLGSASLLLGLGLLATACGGGDDDRTALDIELYTADQQDGLLEAGGLADTIEMVLVNADAPFGQKQTVNLSIADGQARLKGLQVGQRFQIVARGFNDAANDNVPQFYGASAVFTVVQDQAATASVQVGQADCIGLNNSSGRVALRDDLGKDDMVQKRVGLTANLLPDGRVLILGGGAIDQNGALISVHGGAEVYDPASAQFIELSGALADPRAFHTATTLPSGEILVMGGQTAPSVAGVAPLSTTASIVTVRGKELIVQPVAGLITGGAERAHHTATLLADGTVLFVGGNGADGSLQGSTLRYFPGPSGSGVDGRFLPQGDLTHPRAWHTTTVIERRDELAVVAGGMGTDGPLDTVEVFTINPGQGCQDPMETASQDRGCFFKRINGRLAQPRWGHAAVSLDDGFRIAFIGGFQTADGDTMVTPIELMDVDLQPRSGAEIGALGFGVGELTATELDDGSVLVVGGRQGTRPHAVVSRLNPTRDTTTNAITGFTVSQLSAACELSETRYGHTAVLTKLGTVMVTGGMTGVAGDLAAQRRGEIYFPRITDISSIFR